MGEIDESELTAAGQRGATVDGRADGAKRVIDAAVLRRCCHELRDRIDPRGLRLTDAIVIGCLDLTGLVVPFSLRFEACEFDTAPVLEGAQLFELSLTGSPRLPGLLGNGLRLRRDLDLSRSHISGAHWTNTTTDRRAAIWLCDSEIGGRVLGAGTTIDGQGDRAVRADRIHVSGSVRLLDQFTSRGEIRLLGARIGGSVDLAGARLSATGGPALDLEDATIEGSMFLTDDAAGNQPEVRGRIGLRNTRILGRLHVRQATIDADPGVLGDSGDARSVKIGSAIDASRLSVAAEVAFAGRCEVTGGIDMTMGEMSSVSFGAECLLRAPGRTALDLTNAEIRAHLRLDRDAAVEGTIRLEGATTHGMLALNGQLSRPEHRSLVGGSAMTVDGDVYLDGLRADGGRINLRGATMRSLVADGARLHNPGDYSISLKEATVKGSVQLTDGFASTGLVVLSRSTIEGRLQFTGGSFTCPAPTDRNLSGDAIEAISATVRGGIDLGWQEVSPSVDFSDTTTKVLADDPATWPPRFAIAGLTYERFGHPLRGRPRDLWDYRARCAWLGRQASFESGPYEQAARVFREHGHMSEAEQILMAQRRHAARVDRSNAIWPRRAVDAIYAAIGYGYRPTRVLWALAILLVLVVASLELPAAQGTLRATNGNGDVYGVSGLVMTPGRAGSAPGVLPAGPGRPDVCGDGEVRCFSPVLYAIDTVVPLISLNQRSTWYPDTRVRYGELVLWWLNLATLLGWLLSSIFVLSLARLSRSP
ncbi:MAG TPA: hypothetical protein VIX15_17875 [Streptosporangiaceae bacterium]